MGYQTMRRRLSIILGTLAVVGLLATPVASAAPGQSSWDIGGGRALDQCTGEYFDNSVNAHFVETDSGPSHFNNHLEGIGETSGSRYVSDTVDNGFLHALPDGTFMVDQVLNLRIVSLGNLPNSWLTIRIHLVVDSDGNVISGTSDFSFGCRGKLTRIADERREVLAPGPLLSSSQRLSPGSGPGLAIRAMRPACPGRPGGSRLRLDEGQADRTGPVDEADWQHQLNQRLRAEFIASAEEEWRKRTGRPMTAEELERVLRRYPGVRGHPQRRSTADVRDPANQTWPRLREPVATRRPSTTRRPAASGRSGPAQGGDDDNESQLSLPATAGIAERIEHVADNGDLPRPWTACSAHHQAECGEIEGLRQTDASRCGGTATDARRHEPRHGNRGQVQTTGR